MKGSASFPDFTRPKTALQLGTEHGLTSEFGTGSGGTRALWPASTQSTSIDAYILLASSYKIQVTIRLSLKFLCKTKAWLMLTKCCVKKF